MAGVVASTAPRVQVFARSGPLRARLVRAVEGAGIPVLHASVGERDSGRVDVVVVPADELTAIGTLPLSTGVVVVGGDPATVAAALSAANRAWGVVPETAEAEALGAAVHAVAAGLRVLPSTAAAPIRLRPETESVDDHDMTIEEPLTPREHEVLELAALGLSNHAIGVRLAISDHTVKFHLASVYGKLGVRSRTAAVRRGLARGLITI
jgi:DNA-binding NarL/FixJ family response regulator